MSDRWEMQILAAKAVLAEDPRPAGWGLAETVLAMHEEIARIEEANTEGGLILSEVMAERDALLVALNRAADRIGAAEDAWLTRANAAKSVGEQRDCASRSYGLDEAHGILMDEAKAVGVSDAD